MRAIRSQCRILLPVAMMFVLNSCTSHRIVDRPVEDMLPPPGEVVQISWGERELELHHPEVHEEILSGSLYEYGRVPMSNAAWADRGRFAFDFQPHQRLKAVSSMLVQVAASFPLVPDGEIIEAPEVAIPFANILKVKVRESDATISVLRTIGVVMLAGGVALAIVAATKDSCPFVYVKNGGSFDLVGEIYSGAIHPPLERHDYMALPLTGVGTCELKITNEVMEIQHTNLAELQVYDHALGERVLVDRHGDAHLIARQQSPTSARAFSGADVHGLVAADDDKVFIEGGPDPDAAPGAMDGMVLTFDRPETAAQMKLVVNARNSRWLDHVLGVLFERMGDAFKPWLEAQKTGSAAAMQRWSLDQGLPLAVSVMTSDGWRFVDYIDPAGPIAARVAVVPVDLTGVAGEKVTLKLECGYRFWEIDSVAADFTQAPAPRGTVVGLSRAVTKEGLDVTADLAADDDAYLHQPSFTDEAILTFDLPELACGRARSVILHSKGHYDILRSPEGQPDLAFMASFREPGRVTEYSRDLYRVLSGAQER